MAKTNWPSNALLDLIGTELPIIQAPMAGAQGAELAIAVAQAGGLGSLACAILSASDIEEADQQIRRATNRPFNLNFFCHRPPETDQAAEAAWLAQLAPYMAEYGLEPSPKPLRGFAPFDETMCSLVEELGPKVVSFHFGLPAPDLLARVKQAGAVVLSSATTVAEARFLAEAGADAVIAQGLEAGGHRGMFLETDIAGQVGTMALVPQIIDAIDVPVIAAGGIADGRGLAAAIALGAAGVQIGTAYLLTPQSTISELHRAALRASSNQDSALTNVFSGRPARSLTNRAVRELGPMAPDAPAFPLAASALAPLRKAAEAAGCADFTPLWSGQAGASAREIDAGELTRQIADEALDRLRARGPDHQRIMAPMAIPELQTDLEATGLVLLGGFDPDGKQTVPVLSDGGRPATLLLVGSAGPAIWEHFTQSPEFVAPEHPLDRWTGRVVGEIAGRHNAEAAFPFRGPPYWPFQQWGLRCNNLSQSPLGVLVHPRYGPWFAFRGALLFAEKLALDLADDGPGPCPTCADKPCLDACPSGALTRTSAYDADICRTYVRENANHDCAERGCLVRHACPFGRDYAYLRPQASFHMRAFAK